MNARVRLCLLGLALMAAIAVGWFFRARTKVTSPPSPAAVVRPAVPREEPVYQGKPLRYWVTEIGKFDESPAARQEAVAAIRAIGSNAVPFLLDWMPRPETLHQDQRNGVPDPTDLEIAWWALGTNGQSAIPFLAQIITRPMHRMDDYSVWTYSAKAISHLGPGAIAPMLIAATNMQGKHEVWELLHNFQNLGSNGAPAIPALISWANDSDYFVRDGVVSALGGIGQRPDLALPVILNALEHDPNGMVRRDAGEALGAFANDSDAVLPELIKMLKDPNWEARQGALSGLGKIRDKPDVVIALIVPFLSDENSVIERTAAYALRDLDCRSAYEALAKHSNPNIGDIVYEAGEEEKARRKSFK